MKLQYDSSIDKVLEWCGSIFGSFELEMDQSRVHAGERASAYRLRIPSGYCYLKMHRDAAHWESEVHAYEQWATAFGDFAPKLLAVRETEPLALAISELPGQILEKARLSAAQKQAVWRAAGRALVGLHDLPAGAYFGPCRRDGTSAGIPMTDAREYVLYDLENWLDRGLAIGCLSDDERAIVNDIRGLVPAFAGEEPVACHRDYCPANWLVTGNNTWAGVIDFEFSYWDVRMADFARFPEWDWIGQPGLLDAFREGYGRSFSARDEQQLLVAQVQYALAAVVWGKENEYHIYAEEGRQALQYLAKRIAR